MSRFLFPQNFEFTQNALAHVERCFILGNGPTVNKFDLDALKGEFTIGLNRILYTGFVPSLLAISDPNCLDKKNCDLIVKNSQKIVTCRWVQEKLLTYNRDIDKNILKICNTFLPENPLLPQKVDRNLVQAHAFVYDALWYGDFDKTIWLHSVLGDLAIPCAIYLGIKIIYLIGVDDYWEYNKGGKTHFTTTDSDYSAMALRNSQNHHINMNMLYSRLALIANQKYNVEIFNLSPGSAILAFPKIDPETVVKNIIKKERFSNCGGFYIVILDDIFKIIQMKLHGMTVYRFINIENNKFLYYVNDEVSTMEYSKMNDSYKEYEDSCFYIENGFTNSRQISLVSIKNGKYVTRHPYFDKYILQNLSANYDSGLSTFQLFRNLAEAMLQAKKTGYSYFEELREKANNITEESVKKYGINFLDSLAYQKNLFNKLHLDYEKSQECVDRYFKTTGMKKEPMFSEHYNVFAALSIRNGNAQKPLRILELGTYTGAFTHFLSHIFPKATIISIDLPSDSTIFRGLYGRNSEERIKKFLDNRAVNLQNLSNVTFIEIESFLLPTLNLDKFDIIFIDAGHTIPDVCFDIVNAFHLIKDDGYILCDDIYINDDISHDTATYKTLLQLQKMDKLQTEYFLKRFFDPNQKNRKDIKYVSISQKIQ